jgi:hypothetical protein
VKVTFIRTSSPITREDGIELAEFEPPAEGAKVQWVMWPNQAMPTVYVIWRLEEPG